MNRGISAGQAAAAAPANGTAGPVPSSGPSIVRACAEAARACAANHAVREQQRSGRRLIDVVDGVLDVLEEITLTAAEPEQEPLVGEWLLWLGTAVEEPLPVMVRCAESAIELHDALLDWQTELLDRAVPARSSGRYPDDDWDGPARGLVGWPAGA
jgi:hypothetical protein